MYYIYALLDRGEIVYIGRSKNVKKRMYQHKSENKKIYDSFEILKEIECLDKAKRAEDYFIKKYDCKYNKSNNEYGAYISFKDMMVQLNKTEDELDDILYEKKINPIFKDNYKLVTLDLINGKDFELSFRGIKNG